MTPDERQLLSGLFDRIRNAGNQPRDRDAESFINDAVRSQPYAPYLLSQTVIVQDQALRAANDRLQQLEARVKELEGGQGGGQPQDTSFLGSLGRSIFGSGEQQQQRAPAPQQGYGQGPGPGGYGGPGGGYPGGQGGGAGPWGQGGGGGGPWAQQGGAQGGGGGGFLKGALGAAAGVAGGVLLANSISGLMRGNPLGITSGVPGMGGIGGETVINNYYDNDGAGGMAPGNDGDFGPANDAQWDNTDFGSGGDDLGPAGDDFGSDDMTNV